MPKIKGRVTVFVDEDICKGCGLCLQVCPRKALGFAGHTNTRGFHPASLLDPDGCTGCANCALMCPDACIRITRARD